MTLGEIKKVYVKHMGNYTNDADDPSVFGQYMPEALAYINEGYAIVMAKFPDQVYEQLREETDEPLFDEAFHAMLAEYAAAKTLISEPGKMERAAYLMNNFTTSLFKLQGADMKLLHRWG